MEFYERLKKLRKEKNVSQQDLANAIFVSRSAVAKWENGLGLPGEDSYRTLLTYFHCGVEALPLHEERDALLVRKNRMIRKILLVVLTLSIVLCLLFSLFLMIAATRGYGFSADVAAGRAWQDDEYIHTSDYVFYYDGIPLKYVTASGEEIVSRPIDHFCAVEKRAIGYERVEIETFKKRVLAENGNEIGYLYVFPGEEAYYYFFLSSKVADPEKGLTMYLFEEIQVKEETLSLLHYSFFTYPFEIFAFSAYGATYTVK